MQNIESCEKIGTGKTVQLLKEVHRKRSLLSQKSMLSSNTEKYTSPKYGQKIKDVGINQAKEDPGRQIGRSRTEDNFDT